jgi:hypothetical protein
MRSIELNIVAAMEQSPPLDRLENRQITPYPPLPPRKAPAVKPQPQELGFAFYGIPSASDLIP